MQSRTDQIAVAMSAAISSQNVCAQKKTVSPLVGAETSRSLAPKICAAIQKVIARIGHSGPSPRNSIWGIRNKLPEICVAREKSPKYTKQKRKAMRAAGPQCAASASLGNSLVWLWVRVCDVSKPLRTGTEVPSVLSDYFTTRWVELGAVGFFLERRTGNASSRAVFYDCGDREVLGAEIRMTSEMFGQDDIVAIARAARKQVASAHIGSDDFQT